MHTYLTNITMMITIANASTTNTTMTTTMAIIVPGLSGPGEDDGGDTELIGTVVRNSVVTSVIIVYSKSNRHFETK